VRPAAGTGGRQGYATQLAGLWIDLARTLRRLEDVAGSPDELGDAIDELPRLQYELHRASELAAGLDAPAGAETAHAELAAALGDARDATAEVAEALRAEGPEEAATHVHEWRGALFRVRLARLRLAAPNGRQPGAAAAPRRMREPLVATGLVVLGAAVFAAGATSSSWPVWTCGLLLLVCGLLAYRP
jgi:hypothetical protein